MMMAFAMVLAYMPSMAFANETEEATGNDPVVENNLENPMEVKDESTEGTVEPLVTEEPEEEIQDPTAENKDETPKEEAEPAAEDPENGLLSKQSTDMVWHLEDVNTETLWVWLSEGFAGEELTDRVIYDSEADLEYCWQKNGANITGWQAISYASASNKKYIIRQNLDSAGIYKLIVREKNDTSKSASKEFRVYTTVVINNLEYGPSFNDSEAEVWQYETKDASTGAWINRSVGDLTIQPTVKFGDGKTRTVTSAYIYALEAKSIVVPASVKYIEDLGLLEMGGWDNETMKYKNFTPIPGFTIFGKTGSYAQSYANYYGLKFRDLEVEAEAARQGTQIGGMPKMKLKKTTAKKTSIKVQRKKLDKKKLKKSGTTHYEIWVCPNTSFAKGQTVEKIVKKSKSSINIKGLSKKTKYFVRIRAIKYIGGKKMTGPWKQKTVKTKKK